MTAAARRETQQENQAKQQAKRKADNLAHELWTDLATVDRMTLFGSNFYGMHRLMPLIETLAYISLEETWPKQRK
jgi:hypothetical protein